MMKPIGIAMLLLLSGTLATACAGPATSHGERLVPQATAIATPQPALPYKKAEVPNPLASLPVVETVPGERRPLPGAPSLEEHERFASAIDVAEVTNSWAFLIWQGGRLRVEQYMNGADTGSAPHSASMHKTVFAMVTGIAIDDGLFAGLDAPVGDYLSEWRNDPRGGITLRQLLQMNSGLANFSREGGDASEFARFERGERSEALLLAREALRPPGTDFEYMNVNTNLAGLALQRALGQRRYADYLSEKLWKPIGADTAHVIPVRPGGMVITASNLMARAEDWLRIGLLLKDDGIFEGKRILPVGWTEKMLAPSDDSPIYGLQLWHGSPHVPERYYNDAKKGFMVKATESFMIADMVYIDGFGGQRVYVSRERDLVIVRLGPETLDWDDSVLPNKVADALTPTAR